MSSWFKWPDTSYTYYVCTWLSYCSRLASFKIVFRAFVKFSKLLETLWNSHEFLSVFVDVKKRVIRVIHNDITYVSFPHNLTINHIFSWEINALRSQEINFIGKRDSKQNFNTLIDVRSWQSFLKRSPWDYYCIPFLIDTFLNCLGKNE